MLTAKDVMTTAVVSVGPGAKVSDIAKLLFEKRISAVPVLDEQQSIIGIVSEGDLMRRPESGTEKHYSWWLRLLQLPEDRAAEYVKSHGVRAEDVMTRDVATVSEDTPLSEIATLLERRRIKRVPVVRDGMAVGIVSRANLLHGLAVKESKSPATDDTTIRSKIISAMREIGIDEGLVNVVVSGGNVHFWGIVHVEDQRDALRIAAEQVDGVSSVENNVTIMTTDLQGLGWA